VPCGDVLLRLRAGNDANIRFRLAVALPLLLLLLLAGELHVLKHVRRQ